MNEHIGIAILPLILLYNKDLYFNLCYYLPKPNAATVQIKYLKCILL